jgi:hypothetical protein
MQALSVKGLYKSRINHEALDEMLTIPSPEHISVCLHFDQIRIKYDSDQSSGCMVMLILGPLTVLHIYM